jgi:hypothetical protein
VRRHAEKIPTPPPRTTKHADDWVLPEYSPFHLQRGVMKEPKAKAKAKVSDFVRMQALIEKDRQKEDLRELRRVFDASKEGKDPTEQLGRMLEGIVPTGQEKHRYLTEEQLETAKRKTRFQQEMIEANWKKRVEKFWETEKTRQRSPWGTTRAVDPPPTRVRPWPHLP